MKRVGTYLEISNAIQGNSASPRPAEYFTVLKVNSPGVSGDILLAEAIFANNSRIRRDTRLTPFQLVTGQQSILPPIKDIGEPTHHFLNRLKHIGGTGPRQPGWRPPGGKLQYEHTPSSLVASSVGNSDSPGCPNQEKNLGANLVEKGEHSKLAKPSGPKSFTYGYQHQSFSHNFSKQEKNKGFVYKKKKKPPTPPDKIGGRDHNHYKEKLEIYTSQVFFSNAVIHKVQLENLKREDEKKTFL